MALSAGFWATDWVDIRVIQDFSAASSNSVNVGTVGTYTWWREYINGIYNLRQLDASGDNTLNSKTHGRFYAVNAARTDYRDINYIHSSIRIQTDPDLTYGVSPAPDGSQYCYPLAPAFVDASSTTWVYLYYQRPATGGAWFDLFHYQPYTYYGNPARVIASMLIHMGADDDYIDKTNFSTADDGLAAMTVEPMVLVTREVGETLGDTIKRVARHCNDIICVNMSGKLSLVSRTTPPAGPASLDVSETIGPARWRYAKEYIVNKALTSFGEWTVHWGNRTNYPGGSGWTYQARFDRHAEFDTARVLTAEIDDATSQTKYGERVFSNTSREVQAIDDRGRVIDGEYIKRPAIHYPHFFDQDHRDAILERLTAVESTLRREVEIVQDFRGLDYDIGYEVSDVQVTGDGETIAAMTCIEKEIDFRKLTVRSVLLEEPV